MDATKKPLKIPPEFARYAEEKEIFQLLEVNVYNYKAPATITETRLHFIMLSKCCKNC